MAVLGAECILADNLAFSSPTSAQDLISLNFCSIKALWESVTATSIVYQQLLHVSYKKQEYSVP